MDIIHLYENINPFKFAEYLEKLKWSQVPGKRKDVEIYKLQNLFTYLKKVSLMVESQQIL